MTEYLGALAVPPAGERLYRRVLRGDPGPLSEHAAQLGWTRESAALALGALLDVGLVHEEHDGTLVAADPRSAVGRLVELRRADLAHEAELLDAAQDAIAQFAADHDAGHGARRPMWEIVPSDLSPGVAAQALAASSGALLNSVLSVDWSPDGIEKSLARARSCRDAGRQMRALYPREAIDSPQQREWVQRFAEAGEEQRVASTRIPEFAVFGRDIVLAVTGPDPSIASDTARITDPLLIEIFVQLFEHAWDAAVPMPSQGTRSDDRRLLMLLAAGYKDEVIARYLGVALRTVRRRVAGLMAVHGVDTRFQLGIAAERAGLLDDIRR